MQQLVSRQGNLTREQAQFYIDTVVRNAKLKGGNRGLGMNRLFQTRLDTSLINKRK